MKLLGISVNYKQNKRIIKIFVMSYFTVLGIALGYTFGNIRRCPSFFICIQHYSASTLSQTVVSISMCQFMLLLLTIKYRFYLLNNQFK